MPNGAPSGCGGVKCLDVRLGNPRDIAAGKQTPQQVAAQLLATMPALQVSPASAGGVTSHQWRRQLSGNAVSPLNPKSCCSLSRRRRAPASAGGVPSHQRRRQLSGNAVAPKP